MGPRWKVINKIIFTNMGLKKDKFLSVFLIAILIFMSSFNFLISNNTTGTASRNQGTQADIEYLAINALIDNNYATTIIQEKFKNPYNNSINETFSFQIPAKAFISNFSLTIDEKTHYAKIVPKDVGKKKFNDAVKKGTNAGLVESKDRQYFTYSISLSPKEEIIVGLRYEQFLEKSLGGYEYIIPLKGSNVGSNIKKCSVNVIVKSKLNITDLDVKNYDKSAKKSFESSHLCIVEYNATNTALTENFIVKYKLAAPPINGTVLNYYDGTDEFFFHIFSPQKSDLGGKAMPKDIIFVLDKSGSMSGTKIEQLKTAFEEIVNQLHSNDTFNIVMFDSSITKYKNRLIDASEKNKTAAVNYINDITAGGCTNINDALTTALEMFRITETKLPVIVMLTDGLPTTGETDPKIIRKNIRNRNTAGVSLFCLGFGFDLDFGFLKAMSLENFGIAIRIYDNEKADVQITNFYDTISTPLLRGLKFSYSTGAYEVYPTYVEYLFEGTEIVIVGKYNGTSRNLKATVNATTSEGYKIFSETFRLEDPTKISFESKLVSYDEFNDTSKVKSWEGRKKLMGSFKVKKSTEHSFIPRFWAYAKIQSLLDEIVVVGHDESLVENVTNLALSYGFVTPYTSLLVETENPNHDNSNSGNDYKDSGSSNGGTDGGDPPGGSEGESEAEAESESESESEAEAEGESESEGKWNINANQGNVIVHPNDESNNPQLAPNDVKVKDEIGDSEEIIEIETEPDAVTEPGELNMIEISVTNRNEDGCKVYWVGIHFDWQFKNTYHKCTDISKKKSVYLAPRDTEYFKIYFRIPGGVKVGGHTYHILFQYELKDGWYGQWVDYYWITNPEDDFNIDEKFVIEKEEQSYEKAVPEPEVNKISDTPQPVIPTKENSETSTTIESTFNKKDKTNSGSSDPLTPESKNVNDLNEDGLNIIRKPGPMIGFDIPMKFDEVQKEDTSVTNKGESLVPYYLGFLIIIIIILLIMLTSLVFSLVKRRRKPKSK